MFSTTSGKWIPRVILAERILRAADRGVRVRMLLDHVMTKDTDFKFARMNFHPNIEIRVFNPFAKQSFRTLEFLFSPERLNHRMRHSSSIFGLLAPSGGIRPPRRQRSRLALTLAEREEISVGDCLWPCPACRGRSPYDGSGVMALYRYQSAGKHNRHN